MAKKQEQAVQKAEAKTKQKSEAQVSKLKKNRVEECVKEIKEALGKVSSTYYDLARLCYEAKEGNYWSELGYEKPHHFWMDKFGMRDRKAAYFYDIWEAVERCGLKAKQLIKIDWSKMAAMAKILTEENAEEWLAEAEKSSVLDIIEKVKIVRGRSRGKTDGEVVTSMNLKLGEDKITYIENAIKSACDILGSDNKGEALVHICVEWLEQSGVTSDGIALEDHIKYLESRFPVKISYEETEEDLDAETVEDEAINEAVDDDDLIDDKFSDDEITDEEDISIEFTDEELAESEDISDDDDLNFLDDEPEEVIEEKPKKKEKAPKEKKVKKEKKAKKAEADDDLDL